MFLLWGTETDSPDFMLSQTGWVHIKSACGVVKSHRVRGRREVGEMTGGTTGQKKIYTSVCHASRFLFPPFDVIICTAMAKKRWIARTYLFRDACKSKSHLSCVFGCMNELKLQTVFGWQMNRQRSYLQNRRVDRRVQRPAEKKSDGLKIAARGY